MTRQYEQAVDGEWFDVPRTGFRHCCYACGLVHDVDTRFRGRKMQQRWTVNQQATGGCRKGFNFEEDS